MNHWKWSDVYLSICFDNFKYFQVFIAWKLINISNMKLFLIPSFNFEILCWAFLNCKWTDMIYFWILQYLNLFSSLQLITMIFLNDFFCYFLPFFFFNNLFFFHFHFLIHFLFLFLFLLLSEHFRGEAWIIFLFWK